MRPSELLPLWTDCEPLLGGVALARSWRAPATRTGSTDRSNGDPLGRLAPQGIRRRRKLGPWSAGDRSINPASWRSPAGGLHGASRAHGPVIHVGMAGERSGRGTKTPKGLNGRLSAYLTGPGLGGGLLGRSFDRALRDGAWLRERIADLETGKCARANNWVKAALVPRAFPCPLEGLQRRR